MVSQLIIRQRKADKISQSDLAKVTGLSRGTINKLEHGENATLDTLIRVCYHFGYLDTIKDSLRAQLENLDAPQLY